MCLITKQRWRCWAIKDIVCYKVLSRGFDFSGCPIEVTPYTGTPVSEDILTGKDYFRAAGDFRIDDGGPERYVFGGMIHAYLSEKTASCALMTLDYRDIYKCIIPRGTRYMKNDKEICAKKIKFVEKINAI